MNGEIVASEVKKRVKREVLNMQTRGIYLDLDAILIGDNPASETYVKLKRKDCEEVGIKSDVHHCTSDFLFLQLLSCITTCRVESRC